MSEQRKYVGPVYSRKDHAGFLRRLLAYALDSLLMYSVYIAGAGVLIFAFPPSSRVLDHWNSVWWVLTLVYIVGLRLTEGGTLGYRIMGIRFAYVLDGKTPLHMRGVRALMAVYLTWIFVLNGIWVLFDERKQAWHDKVSGFYVVRRRAAPIGLLPIERRIVCFMGFTFFVWEPAAPPIARNAALGRDDARPS